MTLSSAILFDKLKEQLPNTAAAVSMAVPIVAALRRRSANTAESKNDSRNINARIHRFLYGFTIFTWFL